MQCFEHDAARTWITGRHGRGRRSNPRFNRWQGQCLRDRACEYSSHAACADLDLRLDHAQQWQRALGRLARAAAGCAEKGKNAKDGAARDRTRLFSIRSHAARQAGNGVSLQKSITTAGWQFWALSTSILCRSRVWCASLPMHLRLLWSAAITASSTWNTPYDDRPCACNALASNIAGMSLQSLSPRHDSWPHDGTIAEVVLQRAAGNRV